MSPGFCLFIYYYWGCIFSVICLGFFVTIILTIIFPPCSLFLLLINDDRLFWGQTGATFVGVMFEFLSANLLDIMADASFWGLIFN